jgi:Cu+-exporting ATPase
MKRIAIDVTDIHCESCERAIGNALRRLEGVQEVRADSATNTVDVTFDPQVVSAEAIRERLAFAGFPPQGARRGRP